MMKIIRMKPMWVKIVIMGMLVPFIFTSCVNYPDSTWLKKVVDLKSTAGEEWELKYDYKGRLIQYGETSIVYGDNRICVGHMKWNDKKERLSSAVYYTSDENVIHSEACCLIQVDSMWMKVNKQTEYIYMGDSLLLRSRYEKVGENEVLYTSDAYYIYDMENRLVEVVSRWYDQYGKEQSACHSYLVYDRPIRYAANLNVKAYMTDRGELDTFLFFLMGMDAKDIRVLPNRIRHCVNHKETTYIADCIYQMDGERVARMEIISKEIKLKERIVFQYYNR